MAPKNTAISQEELACVYAALILVDDDIPITADKITTILKAAKVDFEPFWPGLFAKALDGQDVKSLLCSLGSPGGAAAGGVAAAAGAAAPAGGAAAAAAPAAAPEKKKEATPDDSSDEDMGLGLFD